MNSQKPIIKVGVVCGEHSGDRLGAKIISSLKNTHKVELFGVGGPKIINQGLNPIFNFEKLHLMGLIEPLLNYRELKYLRKKIINLFLKEKIDYFFGIDSPDFNIGIHKALKNIGKTKNIQVVSPSVWGWREGRIKHIKNYIDLTMCLFNFEDNFYKKKKLPSIHIGHPFSDLYTTNEEKVFQKYSLDSQNQFVSILPGSRKSEIRDLLPTYIDFIKIHSKKNENYDAIVLVYKNYPLAKYFPEQYGWILSHSNNAVKVGNKEKIFDKKDFSLSMITGHFLIKNCRIFLENKSKFNKFIDRKKIEGSIDVFISYLIKKNYKILSYEVDNFFSLGTYNELRLFDYWSNANKIKKI